MRAFFVVCVCLVCACPAKTGDDREEGGVGGRGVGGFAPRGDGGGRHAQGCCQQPYFGVPGGVPRYCAAHMNPALHVRPPPHNPTTPLKSSVWQ